MATLEKKELKNKQNTHTENDCVPHFIKDICKKAETELTRNNPQTERSTLMLDCGCRGEVWGSFSACKIFLNPLN